jgi:hypothetical protein
MMLALHVVKGSPIKDPFYLSNWGRSFSSSSVSKKTSGGITPSQSNHNLADFAAYDTELPKLRSLTIAV